MISGWACDAQTIEISFDGGPRLQAGAGTLRADTEGGCGDTGNGFGLLYNWNLLGDGPHTVTAYADGVEFAEVTVTVTTLGEEFRRGLRGSALYVLYVQERPGLFVGREAREPTEEGIETLRFVVQVARRHEFEVIPVWTVSYNAAEAIARAAQVLQVDTVMMGVSRRSAIYHLLRGHVVNGLARHLPRDVTCSCIIKPRFSHTPR